MKKRVTRRYLAGLLDGEGYFGILPSFKRKDYYVPTIKMALTEKTSYILFEIKDILGGHIYKRQYDNPKYNISFCWEVKNFKEVERVLDYVRPYLILKREQADTLHKFIQTKSVMRVVVDNKSINPTGYVFDKLPKSVFKKRQCLYALMRDLNRRGRLPAETKHETPTPKKEGEAIVRTLLKNGEVNGNISSADNKDSNNPIICQ